jgi:hypothetical protein
LGKEKFRRAGSVAQMAECLPHNCEALSSNPNVVKSKKGIIHKISNKDKRHMPKESKVRRVLYFSNVLCS